MNRRILIRVQCTANKKIVFAKNRFRDRDSTAVYRGIDDVETMTETAAGGRRRTAADPGWTRDPSACTSISALKATSHHTGGQFATNSFYSPLNGSNAHT